MCVIQVQLMHLIVERMVVDVECEDEYALCAWGMLVYGSTGLNHDLTKQITALARKSLLHDLRASISLSKDPTFAMVNNTALFQ